MTSRTYVGMELLLMERKKQDIYGQPARKICQTIREKYGRVEKREKYYHAGKGDWIKHSISADRQHTAKPAKSFKQLRENPQKYDGVKAAKMGNIKAGTTLKGRDGRAWKINSKKKSGKQYVYSLTTKGANMKLTGNEFSKKLTTGDLRYVKLLIEDMKSETGRITSNYVKAFK